MTTSLKNAETSRLVPLSCVQVVSQDVRQFKTKIYQSTENDKSAIKFLDLTQTSRIQYVLSELFKKKP